MNSCNFTTMDGFHLALGKFLGDLTILGMCLAGLALIVWLMVFAGKR